MWILSADGRPIVNTDNIVGIKIVGETYDIGYTGTYYLKAITASDVIIDLGKYDTYEKTKETLMWIYKYIIDGATYFKMPK